MSHSTLAAGIRSLRRKLASQQSSEGSDEHLLHAFLTQRDENAFASLVGRHGPMVLNVCRRVLGHEQDAEDAFQATLLVLARDAGMLRNKTALASFLHGTAYRVALSAKRAAARRRKHEGQAPERGTIDPAEELSWREVRMLLDEEIARLPEKYRNVFVLCCLEELSRAEAARRLGLKERTVLSRLAVARRRLTKRLARRGVELTAALAAIGLATQSASALPPVLLSSTIRAAMARAAGKETVSFVSISVAELMEATRVLSPSKAKAALALFFAATLLGGVGVCFLTSPQRQQGTPFVALRAGDQIKDAPRSPEHKTVELRGRVVGPDNQPVAGAKLYLPHLPKERRREQSEIGVVQRGVTDKKGRFRLELSAGEMQHDRDMPLIATADGFGLAWIDLARKDTPDELTLQLVKDVPIRGRLLTTEGKPVAGVSVTVAGILAHERLDDFLRLFQHERKHIDEGTGTRMPRLPLKDVLLTKPTDKDGRFEITGIGVERIVGLEVKSDVLADSRILVVMRENFDAKAYLKGMVRSRDERPPALFGPSFEHVLGRVEAKPAIEGTVREAGSGKAVAGALVQSVGVSTRTDAQGHYRLVGMQKTPDYFLWVSAPENSSLIGRSQHVTELAASGGKPARVDIELVRGFIVTGRVYDKATGKGVRDCSIRFAPLPENKTPQIEGLSPTTSTGDDGRFRLVTIPGPGVLLATVPGNLLKIEGVPIGLYKPAEFDAADRRRVQLTDRMKPFRSFLTARGTETLEFSNACKVVDVKDDGKAVTCDLALDPGKTMTVHLQDAEGRPLAGTMAAGIGTFTKRLVPLKSATCKIYALDPENPRPVVFLHAKRKLAALATLRGDEKEPVTVKLAPTAVLTGRVLDSEGQPVAGAEIYLFYATPLGEAETSLSAMPGFALQDRPPRTDKEGRFRLETIVPGLSVTHLRFLKGRHIFESQPRLNVEPLQSGQTRDLGDIRTKSRRP